MVLPTQDNDNDAIRKDSDNHEKRYYETIYRKNHFNWTHPGGGIDKVATSIHLTTSMIFIIAIYLRINYGIPLHVEKRHKGADQ